MFQASNDRPLRRLLPAAIAFLIAVAVAASLIWYSEQVRLHEERARIASLVSDHAHAITQDIDNALSATYALAALVRQGQGDIPDFAAIASQMLPFYPGAAALQLAPGGVIRRVVPLAGNEKAIGYNILGDAAHNKEALLAMNTGKLTLAGPFDLIQGGLAAIGRLPVFLDDGQGRQAFWGFTSVLLRFPEALDHASLQELAGRDFAYELWRIDPDTGKKQVIAASSSAPLIDPVEQALRVPNATWTLGVAPAAGWGDAPGLWLKTGLGLLFSLMLANMAKLLVDLRASQRGLEALVAERTAELAAREADLNRAQSIARIGSWRFDLLSNELRWSAETYRIFGLNPGAPIDHDIFMARVHPDDREAVEHAWMSTPANARYDIEHRIVVDGAVRWVREQAELTFAADGSLRGAIGTVQDITERRLAEDQLQQLSAAVEQSSASIVITDTDGDILYVNPQFERASGYAAAEVLGKNPRFLKSDKMLPYEYATLWATIAAGEVWRGEFENVRKDGAHYWELASISPVQSADGRLSGYVAVKEDISARKAAEADLRIAATAFEAQQGMVVTDAASVILRINRAFTEIFGYTAAEAVGQKMRLLKSGRHETRFFVAMWESIQQTGSWQGEIWDRRKSGEIFPVWLTIKAVEGDDGEITHYVGTLTDITERKQIEQALLASESRYRTLFADSKVIMLLVDPDNGSIIDANAAACAYYGYAPAAFRLMKVFDINTLSPEQLRAEMRSAREQDKKHFEFRHRLASGELRDVEVASGPIVIDNRKLLLSIVNDVTERKRAEEALRLTRISVEAASDALFWITAEARIVDVNAAACRSLGYTREELLGLSIPDIDPNYDMEIWAEAFAHLRQHGSLTFESEQRTKDGRLIPVEIVANHVQLGDEERNCAFVRDISERKRTEARMREALVVFNASSQGIMTTDAQGTITSVNPAFCTITGYSAAEAIGRKPSIFRSGRHDAGFYAAMWESLASTGSWEAEIWNRRKNGEIYPQWQSITTVRDAHGKVVEYVALFNDITQRKQQEEVVLRQANFDALTGLANRNLLHDRLDRALAAARRSEKKVGLLFLDLDGFKWINDTLGHHVGDDLLVEVAKRLLACVREQDTVARLGGDEFTIAVHDLTDSEDLHSIGEKVVAVLREPFMLAGALHYLSGSVGITVFPDDGEDVQTLFRNADIAMYKSKQTGKNRFHFYASHMQADAQARMQLESELRLAIEQQAFVLHYQAIVDADSGELVGAEALIRWPHPERGLISPVDFIPVAEDSGLIIAIGEWALRAAARQWQQWQGQGQGSLRLAVNVSSVQFREAGLPDLVAGIFSEYGVDPGRLILEITESVLMDGSEAAQARMREIKALGVGYALDDFGTGFSSLSYLKRFPVDIVKIDRSFVSACPADANDAHLVEAIINMAHSLDLRVTAEGVETAAQLNFLRDLGCDCVQGHLISPPLPAADFAAVIKRCRLLPPAETSSVEAHRLLAAPRRDEPDVVDWLRRLLGEHSPDLASYLARQQLASNGHQLRQLVESHLVWQQRLNDYVSAGRSTRPTATEDVALGSHCPLGHWLDADGDGDNPRRAELARAHRELRMQASQIVADYRLGHRERARRTLAGLRFRSASRRLVVALIDCFRDAVEIANGA